jgi:hypothetical protein
MGSISFQVIGDASVGTRAKTFAVPDSDINRLVAYLKADNELTTPQALLKWAELMMQLTRERVLEHERRAQAIPPFEAT